MDVLNGRRQGEWKTIGRLALVTEEAVSRSIENALNIIDRLIEIVKHQFLLGSDQGFSFEEVGESGSKIGQSPRRDQDPGGGLDESTGRSAGWDGPVEEVEPDG